MATATKSISKKYRTNKATRKTKTPKAVRTGAIYGLYDRRAFLSYYITNGHWPEEVDDDLLRYIGFTEQEIVLMRVANHVGHMFYDVEKYPSCGQQAKQDWLQEMATAGFMPGWVVIKESGTIKEEQRLIKDKTTYPNLLNPR